MNLLLDTHLLLWASEGSPRLPAAARSAVESPDNEIAFSVASLWEIAIKHSRGRAEFDAEPTSLRAALLAAGYREIAVTGDHAVAVAALPLIHKDPFDRLLLAQAMAEDLTLLTADRLLATYPGPIRKV